MKGRSGVGEEKNRVMEGQKYRERVEAEVGYQKEGNMKEEKNQQRKGGE